MILRNLLALFFIFAGINHFLSPQFYLAIMPPILPHPKLLVALSGLGEIFGGIGVLIPQARRLAGYGLMILLLAIFPANIQALTSGMVIVGRPVPLWLLYLRLPFQLVFLWWVYHCCLRRLPPNES